MPRGEIDILVNGARGSRRRGAGTCRGCGNAIWWVASAAGKPIPFDEVPDPIETNGDVETVSTDKCHWSTCEKRDEFKKPAAPKAPPADRGFEF
jgi:hypothetical protein